MPVGTNATVKALHPDDLEAAGASIILANTYHLFLRPGHERIERLGGLHRFMSWDRPILTDSGGFQVVSLADWRKIDDDGATFRSHIDGSTQRLTPEFAIRIQEALGADVAVAFDHPVYPSSKRSEVQDATERTHRWAERCIAARRRDDQALFGVIQGGLEPDLRADSTRFIAALPFDGLNIGGLAGDESRIQRRETIDMVVGLLADDPRPRYLMGLGSPADLLEAVDRGSTCSTPSAVAGRADRAGLGARRPPEPQERRVPRRPGADRGGLPVPRVPAVLPGLHRPSLPGEGAPRVPPRDRAQPDLHTRFHGANSGGDPAGRLPEEMAALRLRAGRNGAGDATMTSKAAGEPA